MVKYSLRVHVLSSLPQKMIESEDDNRPNIYFNLHIQVFLRSLLSLFKKRKGVGPFSTINIY